MPGPVVPRLNQRGAGHGPWPCDMAGPCPPRRPLPLPLPPRPIYLFIFIFIFIFILILFYFNFYLFIYLNLFYLSFFNSSPFSFSFVLSCFHLIRRQPHLA